MQSSINTPNFTSHRFRRLMLRHSLWLSLLAHTLLFSGFVFIWQDNLPDIEKRPSMFIPSYMASQESITPPIQTPAPPAPPEKNIMQSQQEKSKPVSRNGIEKPVAAKTAKPQASAKKASMSAAPTQEVRKFQAIETSKEEQGVHLIGDEKIEKSLRVLLGKAISRHLFYPKAAIEFNVHGTVLVGFTLHPDGQVTNIQLVKPSNAGILNGAALSAINEIAPVFGVREYLSEPKFLVVGIIFG